MNALDYVVLIGTLLGIALYGTWRTRGKRDLSSYLRGEGKTRWFVIGLSVMATQASAITFLSTPGQGYESGLGFVQIYFGMPIALIIIAAFFIPIYRRLNVHTAYEYLGHRFDGKTRLLGAALFLIQRGFGAGITIYAPALVLSTVMNWPLDATIICTGLIVIVYTVSGGSEAVTMTQKYQFGVIFAGMLTAFLLLIIKLANQLTLDDTLTIAGTFHKLQAVDYSFDLNRRYTFWSGLLGGTCLMLSYFGTDQSQVQRYIGGASVRESALGLMFNAVCKIPMQFFILSLGMLVFVFYQFERPPVYFNKVAWEHVAKKGASQRIQEIENEFKEAHAYKRQQLEDWLTARHNDNQEESDKAQARMEAANKRIQSIRNEARMTVNPEDSKGTPKDTDYVFITFVMEQLPHGVIGLLIATFFAAALSSKAAELNALGSATTVDLYRPVLGAHASDGHLVIASKSFIVFWGLFAIAFALFASQTENLIQAVNIVGSVFYGSVLGLFLVAFFLPRVGGTAVFWAGLAAQGLVFGFFFFSEISYLWYNLIGCVACVLLSFLLQAALGSPGERGEALSSS